MSINLMKNLCQILRCVLLLYFAISHVNLQCHKKITIYFKKILLLLFQNALKCSLRIIKQIFILYLVLNININAKK